MERNSRLGIYMKLPWTCALLKPFGFEKVEVVEDGRAEID
jgi:hypothetical protein